MVDPAAGPFLFDTSAEGWLVRNRNPEVAKWLNRYPGIREFCVSAITVTERIRGYSLLWRAAALEEPRKFTPPNTAEWVVPLSSRAAHGGSCAFEARARIETARVAYLSLLGPVLAVDSAVGIVGGEIFSLIPLAPTPPRRSQRLAESRVERLARWRFDGLIAATALVTGMRLVHNNAADFEAIRSAIELSPERFPGLGSLELIRCSSLV